MRMKFLNWGVPAIWVAGAVVGWCCGLNVPQSVTAGAGAAMVSLAIYMVFFSR